jgi:hypothetical protein
MFFHEIELFAMKLLSDSCEIPALKRKPKRVANATNE